MSVDSVLVWCMWSSKEESYPVKSYVNVITGKVISLAEWLEVVILVCVWYCCVLYVNQAKISHTPWSCLMLATNMISANVNSLAK